MQYYVSNFSYVVFVPLGVAASAAVFCTEHSRVAATLGGKFHYCTSDV